MVCWCAPQERDQQTLRQGMSKEEPTHIALASRRGWDTSTSHDAQKGSILLILPSVTLELQNLIKQGSAAEAISQQDFTI